MNNDDLISVHAESHEEEALLKQMQARTPRTDAVKVVRPNTYIDEYVTADFARQLERELAEAKKDWALTVRCHTETSNKLYAAQRELAELKATMDKVKRVTAPLRPGDVQGLRQTTEP